jgi:tRNA G18 (ribose-2'-O)-methylase SpoU
MPVIPITSLDHPGVEVFSRLTDHQLRNKLQPDQGIIIVESPKVIRVALESGYEPLSLLCEQRHIDGDAADIIAWCGDIPVYTGDRDLLASLTGYVLTRGVLCAMRRPQPPTVEEVCRHASRVVVIDGVVGHDEYRGHLPVGAALGIDGVLVLRNACDPMNRRAVRGVDGAVCSWCLDMARHTVESLREQGFRTVAHGPHRPVDTARCPVLKQEPRLAPGDGYEGDGLPHETIAATDYVVRSPWPTGSTPSMWTAAAAVAFWELRKDITDGARHRKAIILTVDRQDNGFVFDAECRGCLCSPGLIHLLSDNQTVAAEVASNRWECGCNDR